MSLTPGTRLGPYEILAQIGAGGMGEVYKARDTRLERIVAIKVSSEQFSERFGREAVAVAALNHPHICTLFDIGPNYLVMEFVDGVPLKGPLPVEEALRLALQIASALEEAHNKGVVHRDLKPDNVLVAGSGVKLLDFGLAKRETRALDEATVTRTETGVVAGTVPYMSPEQAEGKPVDGRSDLFSFGLVLHELLTGQRAFRGETPIAILAAMLHKEPARLNAPPAVEQIVARCLRKSPSDRFQSATELKQALESARLGATEPLPSIAVLAFANLSGDKDSEFFSDGLAEEIINTLVQLGGLQVIARTSAFAFKGKNEDIRKIGETLGVAHVLEGSVRKSGDRIRVTAQLIHVRDGWHLWSQRYDRQLTDVFKIQDEISEAIVDALRTKLHPKTVPAPILHTTEDPDAYANYLRGRYYWSQRTASSLTASVGFYEQALARDPSCAPAYAGLADTLMVMAINDQESTLKLMPRALSAAHKALELRPGFPEALVSLGCVKSLFNWQWEDGARDMEDALRRQPGLAAGHSWYAILNLQARGKWPEAIGRMERALRLDPVAHVTVRDLGLIHFMRRAWDDAEKSWRQAEELSPGYRGCLFWRARLAIETGHFDEALKTLEARWTADPGNTRVFATIAHAWARRGDAARSRAILDDLTAMARTTRVPPLNFAVVHLGLEQWDQALDWLDKACEERAAALYQFAVDPMYDPIRAHPRAEALRLAMGLPLVPR
jgi:eukaryotic-like serine/threonine-protein kinase